MRLHRHGKNARIKSDSLFEAQFLTPLQLWQIQLWQHSQLLSQCSALPFSRGYHTCSIRPGCPICISADLVHSLVACIKQKNKVVWAEQHPPPKKKNIKKIYIKKKNLCVGRINPNSPAYIPFREGTALPELTGKLTTVPEVPITLSGEEQLCPHLISL